MLEGNANFSYLFMELKQALISWDLHLDEMIKVFAIIKDGERFLWTQESQWER